MLNLIFKSSYTYLWNYTGALRLHRESDRTKITGGFPMIPPIIHRYSPISGGGSTGVPTIVAQCISAGFGQLEQSEENKEVQKLTCSHRLT